MVPNVAGFIVKPVDFAMLPACASAVKCVLSTHLHQVALKLYRMLCMYVYAYRYSVLLDIFDI